MATEARPQYQHLEPRAGSNYRQLGDWRVESYPGTELYRAIRTRMTVSRVK